MTFGSRAHSLVHAYLTLVFDCDGVVLDSNRIKTDAFRAAAAPWGPAAAEALAAHHVAHGGVSRYVKFQHFLKHIVPTHATTKFGPGFEDLLSSYSEHVRTGLMSCPVAEGLEDLRQKTRHATWMIVSGGDQTELRETFTARGLAHLFDGGIFGSPDTKSEILLRELAAGKIRRPALMLGDSRYDYEAATEADLDFIFVSQWTELSEWRDFVECSDIPWTHSIGHLT